MSSLIGDDESASAYMDVDAKSVEDDDDSPGPLLFEPVPKPSRIKRKERPESVPSPKKKKSNAHAKPKKSALPSDDDQTDNDNDETDEEKLLTSVKPTKSTTKQKQKPSSTAKPEKKPATKSATSASSSAAAVVAPAVSSGNGAAGKKKKKEVVEPERETSMGNDDSSGGNGMRLVSLPTPEVYPPEFPTAPMVTREQLEQGGIATGVLTERDPSHKFFMRIPYPNAFKYMVDIVRHLLDECVFEIAGEPNTFAGIRLDASDQANACYITVRLACLVTEGHHCFGVSLKTLSAMLKAIGPGLFMEIYQQQGKDSVTIVARGAGNGSYQKFELPMLNADASEKLSTIQSEINMEINLIEFKSIVTTAHDLKADRMRFVIYKTKEKEARQQVMYIVMSCTGDGNASMERVYKSAVEVKDCGEVIYAADNLTEDNVAELPPKEELTMYMDEDFSLSYLSKFLTSMKSNKVTLRMSAEAPIILEHPLGDLSSIRFVLAPLARDDDSRH